MPVNEFYEAIGVIHVHSSYSDGSKKIEEIAKIGEHAGLDFLMFTDHGTLKPLHDGHHWIPRNMSAGCARWVGWE
jgi:histidinol phosphatase-like PHP family hydrolase